MESITTTTPAGKATDQQRKDAIRVSWLEERGGEAARLDASTVGELAFRLLEAGIQPTVEAVRYVNGGSGSPNVIHPAIRDFFRTELHRRWNRPGADATVPKPLLALWDKALREARKSVEAELQERTAALADERGRLEGLGDQLKDESEDLDRREMELAKREEGLTQAMDALRAELDAARAQLQESQVERVNLTARLSNKDDDLAALGESLSEARAIAGHVPGLQAEVEALRNQVRTLEGHRDELAANLQDAKARLLNTETTLANERAIMEQDIRERIAVENRAAQAEQELKKLQAQLDASEARVDKLRSENRQLVADVSDRMARLDSARTELSDAKEQTREVLRQLDWARGRLDRLQEQVDELEASKARSPKKARSGSSKGS